MLPLNTLIGNYRLVECLGKGGMGEVYRAVHSQIDRVVAIKVLSQTSDQEPRVVQRFLNEARIHANLKHPNIVTLYDFLVFENRPCIVMEFVDGMTLADQLYDHTPLPLSEAVFIFQHIVEAIGYVHSHGVVHRDIKSGNIKISSQNEVKLLDFGIAKDASTPKLTREGNFIGTVQYLAPEQLMDNVVGDQGSDIWALGVLLYEMITGHLPFEADSLAACYQKIRTASYPPPESLIPALPQEARAIISRCLQRKSASRYMTAHDLLQDTERLAAVVSTPRLSTLRHRRDPKEALQKWAGIVANHWPLWLSGSALAALIVVVLFLSFQTADPLQSKPVPQNQPRPLPSPQQQVPSSVPATVPVHIDSTPSGAHVYQHNRYVTETPWKFHAQVGERIDAVLKYKGFRDIRIQIHVGEHSNYFVESFIERQ